MQIAAFIRLARQDQTDFGQKQPSLYIILSNPPSGNKIHIYYRYRVKICSADRQALYGNADHQWFTNSRAPWTPWQQCHVAPCISHGDSHFKHTSHTDSAWSNHQRDTRCVKLNPSIKTPIPNKWQSFFIMSKVESFWSNTSVLCFILSLQSQQLSNNSSQTTMIYLTMKLEQCFQRVGPSQRQSIKIKEFQWGQTLGAEWDGPSLFTQMVIDYLLQHSSGACVPTGSVWSTCLSPESKWALKRTFPNIWCNTCILQYYLKNKNKTCLD